MNSSPGAGAGAARLASTDVRGFNYSGSWGTSGLDLWQHHDRELMRIEVGRGAEYFPGWNAARWWLSWDSFLRDEQRFLADFDDGLAVFADHGIVVMPVLFNRWRNPICDFGAVPTEFITPGMAEFCLDGEFESLDDPPRPRNTQHLFRRYLEGVVAGHADDPRIWSWDLCNEPLRVLIHNPESPLVEHELRWVQWLARMCRALGAQQPLTVGSLPSAECVRATEPFVDLISIHPYFVPADPAVLGFTPSFAEDSPLFSKPGFEHFVEAEVAFAASTGKDIVASETTWGAVDDAERAQVVDYTLGVLRDRGVGFFAHALHHSLVCDLHAPEFGPVGIAGNMSFINADGSLRPGHDIFNHFATGLR